MRVKTQVAGAKAFAAVLLGGLMVTAAAGQAPAAGAAVGAIPIVPPQLPTIWPMQLAYLPDGRLLALDRGDANPMRTLILDASGQPFGEWPRPPETGLWRPHSAAADVIRNRVYVAFGDDPLAVFQADGTWTAWRTMPPRAEPFGPTQIVAAPDGSVFATQSFGSPVDEYAVQWWDASGAYRGSWNDATQTQIRFDRIAGLTVDGEGRVLLSRDGARIARFTSRGAAIDSVQLPWYDPLGPRVGPEWIRLDGWAADFSVNNLVIFDNLQPSVAASVLVRYTNDGAPTGATALWRHEIPGHRTFFDASVDPAGNTAITWEPHSRVDRIQEGRPAITVLRPDGTIKSVTRVTSTLETEHVAWERIRVAAAGAPALLFPHPGAIAPLVSDGTAPVIAPPFGVDIAGLPDGRVVVRGFDGIRGQLTLLDDDKVVWQQPCDCPFATGVGGDASRVYATDPLRDRVLAYDAETGVREAEVEVDAGPLDIGATNAGQVVVALAGGEVALLDGGTLQEVRRWATQGSVPIQAVAANANYAVVLRTDATVEIRTLAGELTDVWIPGGFPVDLMIDESNVVHLVDAVSRSVQRYIPDGTKMLRPGNRDPGLCAVRVDKTAAPTRVWLGDSVTVTLEIEPSCPAMPESADVVIVWAPYFSWWYSYQWSRAQETVSQLLEVLKVGSNRVAVLGGPAELGLIADFDDSVATATLAIERAVRMDFEAHAGAAITPTLAALVRGADDLLRDNSASQALPVIVLVGGFLPTDEDRRAADAFREVGGQILAIEVPYAETAGLRDYVGLSRNWVHGAHAQDVLTIAERIRELLNASTMRDVEVVDRPSADVELIGRSVSPPGSIEGDDVVWRVADGGTSRAAFSLEVLPLHTGLMPTNAFAELNYTDLDGVRRTIEFPVPQVEVVRRPDATPPPAPHGVAYLPVALRQEACTDTQLAAFALVIDTSSSMSALTSSGRTKLGAAVEAAGSFVDLMSYSDDQAAVIGFDSDVDVAQELTTDRQALLAALSRLATEPGTDIAAGVAAGHAELMSTRRRPDAAPAMIVLTDGRASDGPEPAVRAADAAKASGVALFTIGLGQDVDREQLARMASRLRWFYESTDAEDLDEVYSAIAVDLPCPTVTRHLPGYRTDRETSTRLVTPHVD